MFYQNDHDGVFYDNLCCKVRVLNETTVLWVNLLILFPELYSLHYLLGKKIQSSQFIEILNSYLAHHYLTFFRLLRCTHFSVWDIEAN